MFKKRWDLSLSVIINLNGLLVRIRRRTILLAMRPALFSQINSKNV